MILRGAQIQPDGHGECGLLPNPTHFNNSPQLSFSGVLANIRINLAALLSLIITSNREIQHVSDSTAQKSFHVTRSRCRVTCRPRA